MGAILARHLLLIASIIPAAALNLILVGACCYTGFAASLRLKLGSK
jgi:hypothetical protein